MKKILVFLLVISPFAGYAQHVSYADVMHFWQARDSVLHTTDPGARLHIIQAIYSGPASDGLKAFLRNKEQPEQRWVSMINDGKMFNDELKKQCFALVKSSNKLEEYIKKFEKLYPAHTTGQTYLLMGFGQQGGTIRGNLSLLFPEVLLRDGLSEKQFIRMGIHEYVHTQQTRPDFQKINVLASCLREGICDFIAEQVTGIKANAAYMAYGKLHEAEIWAKFKTDMLTRNNDNWVSTGNNPALSAPDLGYFVGYRIAGAYYQNQSNKLTAIDNMIRLDYNNDTAVQDFLNQAAYAGK